MSKDKAKSNSSVKQEEQMDFSGNIDTDPNGSYTGVPDNPDEEPVQDVDDL